MSEEDADSADNGSSGQCGNRADDSDEPDNREPDHDLERVVDEIRARVTPDDGERARLRAVADRLMNRAETAATDLCADADVLQVGSTARNTWTSGDRDIDIFVRFPSELERETLEQYGLEVGHATLPDGHEEYAEHPYVKGTVEGFDIDVVPCFRLESATEIRSAVDRTPFHTRYLQRRLDDELAASVRVTKQFLKGIGVYGSDLRTRGSAAISRSSSSASTADFGRCSRPRPTGGHRSSSTQKNMVIRARRFRRLERRQSATLAFRSTIR